MKLAALLPFMETEELKKLAFDIVEGKQENVKLTILFPFLDSSDLDEIVNLLIEKGEGKKLYSALPFVKKETLNKIHQAFKDGKLENFKEEALLPFLDKTAIKDMFNDLLNKTAE